MRARAVAVGVLGASLVAHPVRGEGELECPRLSPPASLSGEQLDAGIEGRDGVVFDDTGPVAALRLQRAGGYFRSTWLGTEARAVFAAVADFDGDGWDDFVGGGESSSFLRIYRNRSFENLPVNWDDPNDVLEPKFVPVETLNPPGGEGWWHSIAAGDFDGNGRPDVFWSASWAYGRPFAAYLYLNDGNDADGDPIFNGRYNAMAAGTSPSQLGLHYWGGTNTVVVDYNGDRKLDLLVASGETNGGAVRIFLNDCTLATPLPDPLPADGPLPCADKPKLAYAGYLVRDMGMGNGKGEFPSIAYVDFDGDGKRDLIAGAPRCCSYDRYRLRIWYGVDGGGVEPKASQWVPFAGAATAVLVGDFSLDGKPDVVVATDNWNYPWTYHVGGATYYYENNGTSTPFSGGVTQQLSKHQDPHWIGNLYDFDLGLVFDYDNDPDGTPDLMIADGNHSSNYYVFANRVVNEYVPCGEVASGVLDLGDLAEREMVVTAARITPDHSLNGGSIRYYLSNAEPPVWVEATAGACGDSSGDLCAQFDAPVGREVRWKAVMCSNAWQTTTPEISGIELRFDYTEAEVHFRGGVVVHDGIAYAGGFRKPGDRGHLFATRLGNQTASAGGGGVYWDAAARLDAMDDRERHLYTTTTDGRARLDLAASSASDPALHRTLGLAPGTPASASAATAVIDWARGARFGIAAAGAELSRLGAVETSTPAVLSPPSYPPWYDHMTAIDQQRWEQFATAHADRVPLVLFGAKDQLVHAVYSRATELSDPRNGVEMWAIAPPAVAAGMVADYSRSLGGELDVRAYPDGSPTLADVKFSDGTFHTVALVGAGNGGRSVFAMDVTETLTDDGRVVGPTPLWSWTPGGADAGYARAKPVVIRVDIAGAERFFAVLGTGVDHRADDKGRRVVAVDVETGAFAWRFDAACALTSDIAAFETDDELEPGFPSYDGYVDRVVFADRCGFVYKLDPGVELDPDGPEAGFAAGMGGILAGNGSTALFATTEPNALGQERPIAGTIGVRADRTGRAVLWFGTGGLDSLDPSLPNELYAVYADDGSLRSVLPGACLDDGRCEKFYGGVVAGSDQVIVTRAVDPPVASESCDRGSTVIEGYRVAPSADGDFIVDFSATLATATVAALFGDAGSIYTTTLGGAIVRIGEPRAATAGADSEAGARGGFADGAEPGAGSGAGLGAAPLTVRGWYQRL